MTEEKAPPAEAHTAFQGLYRAIDLAKGQIFSPFLHVRTNEDGLNELNITLQQGESRFVGVNGCKLSEIIKLALFIQTYYRKEYGNEDIRIQTALREALALRERYEMREAARINEPNSYSKKGEASGKAKQNVWPTNVKIGPGSARPLREEEL